ncbi:hypothetical protein F4703DRAFT_1800177 [Phycomyces blakesleeanus]
MGLCVSICADFESVVTLGLAQRCDVGFGPGQKIIDNYGCPRRFRKRCDNGVGTGFSPGQKIIDNYGFSRRFRKRCDNGVGSEECRSPNRMRGRNQFIQGVIEKIFFCFGRVTVKTGFVYSSAWTLLGVDQTVLRLLGADQTVLETIGCGPDGFDTTVCLTVSFSIGHA